MLPCVVIACLCGCAGSKSNEPAAPAVKADMSMKKDELLEAAAKLGVSVSSRATKAEIIEAIDKASK